MFAVRQHALNRLLAGSIGYRLRCEDDVIKEVRCEEVFALGVSITEERE